MRARILALVGTLLSGCCVAFAGTVVGKVMDEQGPVPYASVYVQENPLYGTISDSAGVFTLLDYEPHQTLVVSFIGYKTMEVKLKRLPKDTLELIMEEQPILLAETEVARKRPHKSKRKQKKEFLEAVWEQMDKDFADANRAYSIVSDYCIYQDDAIAAFEELSGDLVELPEGTDERKIQNKSFSQLRTHWVKRYRNPATQAKFDRLDGQLRNDKNINRMHFADSSALIHRTLWGTNPKIMFEDLREKTNPWEISDQDSAIVLTYHEYRNFLGILKIDVTFHYVLNPYSYRIQKLSQAVWVAANIPFGYKLNADQLAILNVIMLTQNDIDRFRLKKVDADVKRNILFTEDENGHVSVKEKNVISKIKMADKNDNAMYFHQTASIKAKLQSVSEVKPFTPAELNTSFPIYEVWK